GQVRGQNDVGMLYDSHQFFAGGRLLAKDVQRGARHNPVLQRLGQRALINQLSARAIDELNAALHFLKTFTTEESARFGGHRHMQSNEISIREELIETHKIDLQFLRQFSRCVGIVDDNFWPERLKAPNDLLTDPADSQNADHLVFQFYAFIFFLFPLSLFQVVVGKRKVATKRQEHRD